MTGEKVKLSEKEIDEKIAELRKWLKSEPDLPQNIGSEVDVWKSSKLKNFQFFRKNVAASIFKNFRI